MLRATARLDARHRQTDRVWEGEMECESERKSCCCNQLNICSDSIWPGYCSWAYSTLRTPLQHPPHCCSWYLPCRTTKPQNHSRSVPTVCPALRTTSSLRHLCSQFLPALQASWAEINYIEVIYQESLFLAGPRHRAPVPSPLPSLSLSLSSSLAEKRSIAKAKQKQTSNHKMSVVVYFRLVICRCYAYFYLFGLPIISAK